MTDRYGPDIPKWRRDVDAMLGQMWQDAYSEIALAALTVPPFDPERPYVRAARVNGELKLITDD